MDKSEELILSDLVFPIVKELVIPKLKSAIKKFSLKNINENSFKANVQEYLSRRYEKFLVIDTLVFPNKQTSFKVLYEPMTLIQEKDFGETIEIQINDYPKNFVPEYIRVIIEDTAGMGKSTITRKLFLSIIEQGVGIPILIELRQINKNNDILHEIQSQLSNIGKRIPFEIILPFVNEGDFIFLFDGYDEISKSDRDFVINDLHKFIEKANNNYFLITSRPEDSIASFGDFQKFSIKPLNENQAFNLINRYDNYGYKPIAKELIKKLKNSEQESLKDFLTNPFLISLLYKSFEYKKDIPLKKSQFYSQVYDALYESHDLSKDGYLRREKYSNLHLDDFDRVLRYIGYLTSIENKVEYDKNYLVNLIDKAKKYTPDLTFKSGDYLKDLLETVPLFKKDGNYIKWAHKSFQDYFAAKFIWIDAKNNQELILKKIFTANENRRFYNVLDLYYELDPKTFESTILLWLLEDFEKYCKTNYTDYELSESLKRRLENNYHKKCIIAVAMSEHYDKIKDEDNNIMDYYSQKILKSGKDFSQITYHYYKRQRIIVLSYAEINFALDSILELISSKYSDIVKEKSHQVYKNDLKALKEDNVYLVDDDLNNILNSKEMFDLTNELILSGYTIDYDKAFEKLEQIRAFSNNRLEDELFSWL